MGSDKKTKKKCCGKLNKKGKHCSSCPVGGVQEKCKPDKKYCKTCGLAVKEGKDEKKGKKKNKKLKKIEKRKK